MYRYQMYVFVITYSHAIQGRNRIQLKTECKMLLLFLDQNFIFFPMVHLLSV
jgi:hypothetical protein